MLPDCLLQSPTTNTFKCEQLTQLLQGQAVSGTEVQFISSLNYDQPLCLIISNYEKKVPKACSSFAASEGESWEAFTYNKLF